MRLCKLAVIGGLVFGGVQAVLRYRKSSSKNSSDSSEMNWPTLAESASERVPGVEEDDIQSHVSESDDSESLVDDSAEAEDDIVGEQEYDKDSDEDED
ncbi:MAG: hypothetical protein OXI96_10680 [Acidimicrobiaceae bacterium]|nr:hypothetical protein [Acidimicrobiaceae bacterium]